MFQSRIDVLRACLVPGLVFQSVIVGGGYGTGREIAEFFLSHGPLGGLFGMLLAALLWGIVLAIAFELARITRSYDYRSFFILLLGPAWRLFELVYFLITILVLAVLGSAAGEMLAAATGSHFIGLALLFAGVGAIAYFGSAAVERLLTYWSLVLYAVYGVFFIWVAVSFGPDISNAFHTTADAGNWQLDGIRYAAYNLSALVAVLFVLPRLKTRREAICSGFMAGAIGILPGIAVFIAMLAQYPEIVDAPVPIIILLSALGAGWFFILFQIVLFGTFIETGVGIVHAFNERIAGSFQSRNRSFPHWMRLAVAIALLVLAYILSDWLGIVSLIAKGYGVLSYAFVLLVVLPLLTLGVYKIVRTQGSDQTSPDQDTD